MTRVHALLIHDNSRYGNSGIGGSASAGRPVGAVAYCSAMPAFSCRVRVAASVVAAAAALASGAPPRRAGRGGVHGAGVAAGCGFCGVGNDTVEAVTARVTKTWAADQPPWNIGCGSDVEHWNGRLAARPGAARLRIGDAGPVAASSATDAWILPERFSHVGTSFFFYDDALR
jgi:hypothetical protein